MQTTTMKELSPRFSPKSSPKPSVACRTVLQHHTNSHIEEAPDILTAEHRERNGLCLQCGTKLFSISRKHGLFRKGDVVKTPLSIPGVVERGQCLACNRTDTTIGAPSPSSNNSDDHTNVEGVPNTGNSVLHGAVGGRATYNGEFNVYGERDGQGTMKWENGDSYTGAFFNGNRHGSGTLLFADGSEYVGEWECNLQHGIGTRRWTNGDCYTGQYENGKRTGEGRFYFSNGDMYTGQWQDGVMEGFGRYYYSSGQRFEGMFRAGKRRGKGKLQRTDGSVDIGVYHQDVRVGLGVRWNADRTIAWKMLDGKLRKKISIAEAVALDYDIDAAVQALDEMEERVA